MQTPYPNLGHYPFMGSAKRHPGYELKLFSFPERDTYKWIPQIRYNQKMFNFQAATPVVIYALRVFCEHIFTIFL